MLPFQFNLLYNIELFIKTSEDQYTPYIDFKNATIGIQYESANKLNAGILVYSNLVVK